MAAARAKYHAIIANIGLRAADGENVKILRVFWGSKKVFRHNSQNYGGQSGFLRPQQTPEILGFSFIGQSSPP